MKRIGKFSQSQTFTKKLCFADVKQGFFMGNDLTKEKYIPLLNFLDF